MSESRAGVRKLNSAVALAVLITSAGVERHKKGWWKGTEGLRALECICPAKWTVTGLGKSSTDPPVWR